jgi:hypothetical protein
MRKLKYFIALITLAIFTSAPVLTVSAQTERQTDSLKVKIGGTVRQLSGFSGWIKDINGRWITSWARIPYDDPDFNSEYYDKYALGTENLKSMQVRSVTIAGKPHYMLTVNYLKAFEKETMDAKGKVTKSGFKILPYLDYFVFTTDELKNLKPASFIFGKPNFANIRFIYHGGFYNTNSGLQDKRIKERIAYNVVYDHPRDSNIYSYFQFNLLPTSGKRGKFVKFNYSLVYAEKGQQPVLPDYDLFKTQYFEAPYEKWLQFAR